MKIKRKPGWRRVKGLQGFHRVSKAKRTAKTLSRADLEKAVAKAIALGLRFPEDGAE
jgi:hypothetical protein